MKIDDSAFEGWTNLTRITLPKIVKMIRNGAFCVCTGLTAMTIPESVKKIGKDAFDAGTNIIVKGENHVKQ